MTIRSGGELCSASHRIALPMKACLVMSRDDGDHQAAIRSLADQSSEQRRVLRDFL